MTRELAPDRLDWNALCVKVTCKPLADFPEGLPAADADTFIAALAARLKQIAVDKHVDDTIRIVIADTYDAGAKSTMCAISELLFSGTTTEP